MLLYLVLFYRAYLVFPQAFDGFISVGVHVVGVALRLAQGAQVRFFLCDGQLVVERAPGSVCNLGGTLLISIELVNLHY